jgi:UDP-3-O-[3-hydroxymyristoyl] glucosamine N-acyltransferase
MKKLPAPLTVSELAALVGGKALGEAGRSVAALSTLAEAGPDAVAFLENPKYAEQAAASNAGCLLLPPEAKDAPAKAPARVIVAEPRAAFALLVRRVEDARLAARARGVSAKASVHPDAKLGAGVTVGDFAVIEKGATIGDGTTVSALCFVGQDARIGKDCLLHPRSVLMHECVLGDGVILHPGAVVGGDGFGFLTDKKTGRHTKIPQIGNVVIGDRVEVGSNTTIDRGAVGSTVIAEGTQIDNLVQIAHNVRVGQDSVLVSQVGVAGSTTVGRNVILAGQAGVVGHVNIGDGAIVTAQSGVMSDVPPKTTLFGSPGRPHREAFKLQALYGRLPELYEKVKEIEKRLGAAEPKSER